MKDHLLDIDFRLLVLRYGRQKVLTALARLVEQPSEQLEQQLSALSQKRSVTRRKGIHKSLVKVAAQECDDRDEIMETLRILAVAFESRSFLPSLRDVKIFLDRVGIPSRKLKSRADAGPMVIRALSRLPLEELGRLVARNSSDGESDYALLSRAIMGQPSGEG